MNLSLKRVSNVRDDNLIVTWIPKYVGSELPELQLLFKLVAMPLCIGRWGGGS
jgi:hypothetical protein